MTFWDFAKGRRDPPPPDPGKYDIPSTIGSGPKYTMRRRHKEYEKDYNPGFDELPSTLDKRGRSIGSRYRSRERDVYPGPSYNTSTIGTGRKSTIHTRNPPKENENPGPGSYDIKRDLDGPAYTCGTGKRNDFIQDHIIVPPGSYELPQPMSQRRPATISSRAREPYKKKAHPGPCYEVQKPIGSDARKVQFPKGPRDLPIPPGPGPADYQSIEPGFGRQSKLTSRMKTKHPTKEPERNNMPYYDIGTTINPKKRSHGVRPKTSYETMSPGPTYNIGTTINPKNRTIGIRHVYHDPHEDIPSPDSYWMGEVTPMPPPIVSIVGPSDRAPINEKEEKLKPGPGYYETPRSQFRPGEKGYKFAAGRKEADLYPRPDTAAPYHSTKSTLGGPMYTIGSRDA